MSTEEPNPGSTTSLARGRDLASECEALKKIVATYLDAAKAMGFL